MKDLGGLVVNSSSVMHSLVFHSAIPVSLLRSSCLFEFSLVLFLNYGARNKICSNINNTERTVRNNDHSRCHPSLHYAL